MRIGRLIDPRFQNIVRKLQTADVPLKGAYKLKNIVNTMFNELDKYEELRKSALDKYGKRNEAGEVEKDENNNVIFADEQRAAFMAEITDLLNIDVAIPKMSVNDLGEDVLISVDDLFFIEELFQD